jgi:hypothetical protein
MSSEPLTLAYAAGIMDGEGTIGVTEISPDGTWRESGGRRRRRVSPSFRAYVAVVMSDLTIPLWLKSQFGGYLYSYEPRQPQHKPPHRWCKQGSDAAEFCRVISPYLRLKQRQAELLIEFWDARANVVNPRAKGLSPEEIDRRRAVVIQFNALNRRGA